MTLVARNQQNFSMVDRVACGEWDGDIIAGNIIRALHDLRLMRLKSGDEMFLDASPIRAEVDAALARVIDRCDAHRNDTAVCDDAIACILEGIITWISK